MLFTSVFSALYIIICVFLFNYFIDKKAIKIKFDLFGIFVALGFFIRIYLSYTTIGHRTDMSCFSGWADMLYKNGIKNFYLSDSFHDYPPGYMYILAVLGYIKNSFSLTAGMKYVILKFPAVFSDILMGCLVYKLGKKNFSAEISAFIGGFYILNPATVINSSVWGQVDSVYLIFVFSAIYYIMKNKMAVSYILFAVSVLFKPQALIFSPVILFASAEYLITKKTTKKKVIEFLLGALSACAVFFILLMPFGIENVIKQYIDTLSSYPYFTVNAFNLWGMLGLNWSKLNTVANILGYLFIVLICIIAFVIYKKSENTSKCFNTAAFLAFATYMLSVKMHERYAFCAMLLSLCAFCMGKSRKQFLIYLFITLSQTLNISWVFYIYEKDPSGNYKSVFIIIASLINMILLIYQIISLISKKDSCILKPTKARRIEKSDSGVKINTKDIISIVVITLLYSAVALYNLGSMKAPETEYEISNGEKIDIAFDKEKTVTRLCIFQGSKPVDEDNVMTVVFYSDDYDYIDSIELDDVSVFSWHFEDMDIAGVKHITIEAEKSIKIKELALYDEDYNIIIPKFITDNALYDESDTIPERPSFYNGTYFDEIYHARTAYEFINGIDVYEWTHPPLGKVIMSFGIRIFGMDPFGWRIAGTLFGILMLPFIYIFAKKITKASFMAFSACLMLACDFMHFSQTRIATIDVYITFFVILMYCFMYSYYNMSFYDTKLSKTFVPLFLSGVCFGLGVSSKWTGVYAGAGLCILFFMTLHKRFKEYLYAKEYIKRADNDELIVSEDKYKVYNKIKESFLKNTVYTLAFCVFAFIIIPIAIYLISYIPFIKCEGGGILTVIKNQKDMFIYHSMTVLDSTHPYSSKWYEWIIMKRPIWYYSGTLDSGLKEGISAFGNPLIWWGGILAILLMIYRSIFKKDKISIFLTVAYFAQLIPWIFVDRVVFIYHYFPCVPFIVLSICYCFYLMYEKNKKSKYALIVYLLAAVFLFAMFYPVISGMAVEPDKVIKYLRWFSSWVLI